MSKTNALFHFCLPASVLIAPPGGYIKVHIWESSCTPMWVGQAADASVVVGLSPTCPILGRGLIPNLTGQYWTVLKWLGGWQEWYFIPWPLILSVAQAYLAKARSPTRGCTVSVWSTCINAYYQNISSTQSTTHLDNEIHFKLSQQMMPHYYPWLSDYWIWLSQVWDILLIIWLNVVRACWALLFSVKATGDLSLAG